MKLYRRGVKGLGRGVVDNNKMREKERKGEKRKGVVDPLRVLYKGKQSDRGSAFCSLSFIWSCW